MTVAIRYSVVLAIASLFLLPALANAQSTRLTRLSDRDDLLGWEAVGRLDIRGRGYCSGTLIAPDLVLTAAHCVYDKQTNVLHDPQTPSFRAGLRDGVAIAERAVSQIAVTEQFVPGAALTTEQVRHDVALLRLAKPIVSSDADPFILHSGQAIGTTVSVTSYGQGRSEALSRQRSCNIIAATDDVMAFDCDVTFGSSGAPVFALVGSRGRIVSVISGVGTLDGHPVSLGPYLPANVARLKVQLRNAPRPVPDQIKRLSVGDRNQSTGAKFIRN
ncbi:trypsin-like serine peptidase [Sedimentitalea todarodis]|uniref:Trypsin-like serine protease n=1 Tax=Sedimentitalea todarodis TaxID=1631240 RepID=A0ABU3VIV1_9RHOB|nr:trypsin-like serine protease [Sedimentitalea todarodis]MDU9006112.1 trypsin-like serine protease [Sedimentitalea todarodis]